MVLTSDRFFAVAAAAAAAAMESASPDNDSGLASEQFSRILQPCLIAWLTSGARDSSVVSSTDDLRRRSASPMID